MWLSKLKIALVQKDTVALEKLLKDIPTFSDEKDIKEAMYLTKEVVNVFQKLKEDTTISMKLIKKNIDFLKSTQTKTNSSLDITS